MKGINALAHSVIAVRAGWSRSQKWLLCARVLWNSVHHPQPIRAPSTNVDVVDKQRAALSISRLCGDVEQLVRVGWRGGFGRA